jgi:hypothetical protein
MRSAIEILALRSDPFIGSEALAERQACDTICRMPDGFFLLHLSASNRRRRRSSRLHRLPVRADPDQCDPRRVRDGMGIAYA